MTWTRPLVGATTAALLLLAFTGSVATRPVAGSGTCQATGKNTSIIGGRSNVATNGVFQAWAQFNKVNPGMCTGSKQYSASSCWTMLMRNPDTSVYWGQVGWARQVAPAPPAGVPTTDAVLLTQTADQGVGLIETTWGFTAIASGSVSYNTVYSGSTDKISYYRADSLVHVSSFAVSFEPNQAQYACETWNPGDDIGGNTPGTAVFVRNASAQFGSGGARNEIALTKYELVPHVPAYKRIWYSTNNDFDDYTTR